MKAFDWIWTMLCLQTYKGSLAGGIQVELNSILGENVTFSLQVTDGFKIKEVVWNFRNNVIASIRPRIEFLVRHKDFKGRLNDAHQNGSLQISNVNMKDRGLYSATITNAEDSTENIFKDYKLNIFHRISKVNIDTFAEHVNGTCNITMNCTAEEGEVNVTWSEGNVPLSWNPILSLNWTKSHSNVTVCCRVTNPVSDMSVSETPWRFCEKGRSSSVGVDNTGLIAGGVVAVIIISACLVFLCYKKKGKGPVAQTQTTYALVNRPANATQEEDRYTRTVESNPVVSVYSEVQHPKKKKPPAANNCPLGENGERTVYAEVQKPKCTPPQKQDCKNQPRDSGGVKNGISSYANVHHHEQSKSDETSPFESVSHDPTPVQATSYNVVI